MNFEIWNKTDNVFVKEIKHPFDGSGKINTESKLILFCSKSQKVIFSNNFCCTHNGYLLSAEFYIEKDDLNKIDFNNCWIGMNSVGGDE